MEEVKGKEEEYTDTEEGQDMFKEANKQSKYVYLRLQGASTSQVIGARNE